MPAHDRPPNAPRFTIAQGLLEGLSEPDAAAQGALIELDADQSHHAVRVLRLSAGDRVTLMDGQGNLAPARIASATGKHITCNVESIERIARPTPHLTIATAIPKGPRGDAMANDLAQLGTDVFVPMHTARSVVHPGQGKLDRYRKASAQAAKQCGRAWWMQVAPLMLFEDVLTANENQTDETTQTLKLLADPAGEPMAAVMPRLALASSVVVLIGPEGGFTAHESAAAREAGWVSWCFAPHTLRIETAACAAAAILRA